MFNGKIVVVLMICLAFLITACGANSNNSSSSNTDSNTAKETPASNSSAEKKTEVKFPAKEVVIVVPTSPGGGYDTQARLLANHWKKNLGNNASVVVVNKPGGEWNIGINEVWKAKPDGHTVGIFNIPGNAVNHVTGNTTYTLTKFEWLGRASNAWYVAVASKKSGLKTVQDFKSKGKVAGGVPGVASGAGIGMIITADAMGFQMNVIPEKGTQEILLSTIRGDIDWMIAPFNTSFREAIKNGEVIPLWVYKDKRDQELPNVPTVTELGFQALADNVSLQRVMATTPGTPPEVLKILRDSLKKTLEDPDYIAEATKAGFIPDYAEGEKIKQIVEQSIKLYEGYKQLILDNK